MSNQQHQGLPVAGYKPQSDEKVALVNENKALEERILRQMDRLAAQPAAPSIRAGSPSAARQLRTGSWR